MHDRLQMPSSGLVRCLQALAEEVDSLGLTQTHLALHQAISLCHAELLMRCRSAQGMSVELMH